jgi:hypothetical protein
MSEVFFRKRELCARKEDWSCTWNYLWDNGWFGDKQHWSNGEWPSSGYGRKCYAVFSHEFIRNCLECCTARLGDKMPEECELETGTGFHSSLWRAEPIHCESNVGIFSINKLSAESIFTFRDFPAQHEYDNLLNVARSKIQSIKEIYLEETWVLTLFARELFYSLQVIDWPRMEEWISSLQHTLDPHSVELGPLRLYTTSARPFVREGWT